MTQKLEDPAGASGGDGAPRGPDRSKMALFYEADAPPLDETGMMRYGPVDDDVAAASRALYEAGVGDGAVLKQLLRHSGEGGFSLVYIWWKANYHLPRHSHDCDCVYYVISGQVLMGSKVLGAGDGFYVPADHPYGYRAGPEGAEVLEFRHSTEFDFVFHEKAEGFAPIIDAVRANAARWAADVVAPVTRRRGAAPG